MLALSFKLSRCTRDLRAHGTHCFFHSSASCHRAPDYRAPAPAAKTSNESRALDALRGEVQGEMRTLRAELGELRAARKEDGRVLREILSLLTSSGKSTSASQEHAGAVEMV